MNNINPEDLPPFFESVPAQASEVRSAPIPSLSAAYNVYPGAVPNFAINTEAKNLEIMRCCMTYLRRIGQMVGMIFLFMSSAQASVLYNYIGTSADGLYLQLGDNGPKWESYSINYQSSGNAPCDTSAPNNNWSVWNVYDAAKNYYGTLTVNAINNCSSVQLSKYESNQSGYYLSDVKITADGAISVGGVIKPAGSSNPPIISNNGWINGMRNNEAQFTPGASFWVQDYGMNEPGRWTVDEANNAISQSTALMNGNSGSRAYPMQKDAQGNYTAGVGGAFEGVWQIDMKIGSNGGNTNFSETFYLAERVNLEPGPKNYLDGSGNAEGGNGREIDILETKWKPNGPQINLPGNKTNTSWNPTVYQSQQMANWTDIGGVPTTDFITFGAYIKNNTLWIYAYEPNGRQWYSTDAIPLNNTTYKQKGAFVPYIGTWSSVKSSGNFSTEYKNFIYLPPDKIQNLNPYNNPDEFYNAVKSNVSR